MTARFLIRFDDICPTLNWTKWDRIVAVLKRLDVKPLLAVVPDNRDPHLMIDPPNPRFWELVRDWQALGWTIAVHGYQHAYVTNDAGIVGLNAYSEFTGLPHDEQRRKIEAALAIFSDERVNPDAWIAPAHSFDAVTVRVLLENGLRVISDGFSWRPIEKLGATWIPQQLWQFRRLPAGLWTVCVHANELSEEALQKLELDIERFRPSLVSLGDVLREPVPTEGVLDRMFARGWLWKLTRRRARPSRAAH